MQTPEHWTMPQSTVARRFYTLTGGLICAGLLIAFLAVHAMPDAPEYDSSVSNLIKDGDNAHELRQDSDAATRVAITDSYSKPHQPEVGHSCTVTVVTRDGACVEGVRVAVSGVEANGESVVREAVTNVHGTAVVSAGCVSGPVAWIVKPEHTSLAALGYPRRFLRLPRHLRIEMCSKIVLSGIVRRPDGTCLPAADVTIAWVDVTYPNAPRLECKKLAISDTDGRFRVDYGGYPGFQQQSWLVAAHSNFVPATAIVSWEEAPDKTPFELRVGEGVQFTIRFLDQQSGVPIGGIRSVVMADESSLLPTWRPDTNAYAQWMGLRVITDVADVNGVVTVANWPSQSRVRLRIFDSPRFGVRILRVDRESRVSKNQRASSFEIQEDDVVNIQVQTKPRIKVTISGDASRLTEKERRNSRIFLQLERDYLVRGLTWNENGSFSGVCYVNQDVVRTNNLFVVWKTLNPNREKKRFGPFRIVADALIDGLRL